MVQVLLLIRIQDTGFSMKDNVKFLMLNFE